MHIVLYRDETIQIAIEPLMEGLNALSAGVRFSGEPQSASIEGEQVSNPDSYRALVLPARETYNDVDYVVVATDKPYDNNYFFDSDSNVMIVSFSNWGQLTSLPLENGLVYILGVILIDHLQIGSTHDENRGCIKDFLWDKRGVDVGMRAAFICPACKRTFDRQGATDEAKTVLASVEAMLDTLSVASRSSRNVTELLSMRADEDRTQFDVFLCHNGLEKEDVRRLNDRLKALSIRTWLDEEQLTPGRPWQDELEAQIPLIRSAVVCVGSEGIGPWQNFELKAFLQEFVRRGSPVIPVILSSCESVPELPMFLRQFQWVDLRKDRPDPILLLTWGITQKKPKGL